MRYLSKIHKEGEFSSHTVDVHQLGNTTLAFVSLVTLGLMPACTAENSNKVAATDTTSDNTTTAVYAAQVVNIDYEIGGKVVDNSSSQPIEGATVTFLDQTAQTDIKGEFTITSTASDCAVNNLCQLKIAGPTGHSYTAATKQLVDTDTSVDKFVSLGNVIKLTSSIVPIPTYMVTPVYAAQVPSTSTP